MIVDDEILNREYAAQVLVATGWRVSIASDGPEALGLLQQMPVLILLDLDMAGMNGLETAAAIRGHGETTAGVAILAYTAARLPDPTTLLESGFDGIISKPCTPSELAGAAALWRPNAAGPVLTRLEEGFGRDHIRAMTGRFRALLFEALAALDDGEAAAIAHRVAGIAGTLGFAEAGKAWLALSETSVSGSGDHLPAIVDARREARRAITAIDHHLKEQLPHT